ncbi:hypothetical protein MHU86_17983 [Fragilaria crotonensis]|nr:hypothetical protein MHU86_17983 [Fragilaria crotonensis]
MGRNIGISFATLRPETDAYRVSLLSLISPDGTTLYYGDIVGNVRALQVEPDWPIFSINGLSIEAPLPTMSESPTVVGYTRPPAAPVGLPSIEPLRSAAPITPPTSGSSSLSTVIMIVTAVLVLTLVTLQ